ncbi:MAG TPA: nucleotide exchange factor GrpE [Candidatus Dormibacteraeota bacterium]|jgi:molecular chaperone GrpE|nr:nucleotide exchange factor GrpE [Candidatus Dormibacteraeota bacterium]
MTTKRDPKSGPRSHAEKAPQSVPAGEETDQDVAEDAPDAEVGANGAAEDERYLRLAADFENFRRRKNQELADRSRYASEDAARALLPVLDNLRRAVAHAAEDGTTELVSGLELVVREFEAALGKLGVEPVDAVGQPFDPSLHEAIAGEERGDVDVDTVIDEVQRGYRLHDRLLRPSLVRVAHPSGATESDA